MPELVEERQAKVEATLEQVDRRLTRVEATLEQMDKRLSNVEIAIRDLGTKIDANFRWTLGMWITTIMAFITTILAILLKK